MSKLGKDWDLLHQRGRQVAFAEIAKALAGGDIPLSVAARLEKLVNEVKRSNPQRKPPSKGDVSWMEAEAKAKEKGRLEARAEVNGEHHSSQQFRRQKAKTDPQEQGRAKPPPSPNGVVDRAGPFGVFQVKGLIPPETDFWSGEE